MSAVVGLVGGASRNGVLRIMDPNGAKMVESLVEKFGGQDRMAAAQAEMERCVPLRPALCQLCAQAGAVVLRRYQQQMGGPPPGASAPAPAPSSGLGFKGRGMGMLSKAKQAAAAAAAAANASVEALAERQAALAAQGKAGEGVAAMGDMFNKAKAKATEAASTVSAGGSEWIQGAAAAASRRGSDPMAGAGAAPMGGGSAGAPSVPAQGPIDMSTPPPDGVDMSTPPPEPAPAPGMNWGK